MENGNNNDHMDEGIEEEDVIIDEVADTGVDPFSKDDDIPDSPEEKKKVPVGQIAFSILFYVGISLATVFTNKYIFSYMTDSFDFPLTVTCYQVLFSAVAMLILCPLNQRSESFQKYLKLPKLTFSKDKLKAVIFPCLIFTLMISFNNFCLSFVDVTLYLVFRSLTVLFSVVMTYLILKQSSSVVTILSLVVVSAGYILGSAGGFQNNTYTLTIIIQGMLCGTCSSFFVALNSIFAKRVIRDNFNNDFWEFLVYQNIVGFFMFLIVSLLSGEIRGVLQYEHFFEVGFVLVTLGSCIFGFLINIAYNLLIKSTTPLTKETVATSKACLQPIIGYFLFKDELNLLTVLGAVVCIFGSFFYSLTKMYGK